MVKSWTNRVWSYRHANFTVHQLSVLRDNYIYLIEDHNSERLLAVDPAEAVTVRKACRELGKPLTDILVTHHHWDHTDGIKPLKQEYGARVIGSAIDADRIPCIDRGVDENSELTIGGLEIGVLFVPGHTCGHVAYLIKDATEDALFCGDTLFGAGCGRLFEGTYEEMWSSLVKLSRLAKETKVYCAHEYTLGNLRFAMSVDPDNADLTQRMADDRKRATGGEPTIPSTIAAEVATNPFLRPLDPSFVAKYSEKNGTTADALELFIHIRKRKNDF